MDERDAPGCHLDAEIAPGDHDRVGRADDAGKMVEGDRGLDLRDELRPVTALGEPGTDTLDVLGPPYERQPDEVGLQRDRHPQRDRVGFRERLDV